MTLDAGAPVLAAHPERVYSWIAEANIVIPEVLLVPLYIGGKTPLGTLWAVSDKEGHFDMGHARAVTDLASFVDIALSMLESKRLLESSLKDQQMLVLEMDHRVKNSFSVAEGLVRMTAKNATNVPEMTQALAGRLRALADAHSLVCADLSGIAVVRKSVNLSTLIRMILRPHYALLGGVKRISVEGPEVACGDHATTSVALVVHELATNAVKYGALLEDSGRVEVAWNIAGEELTLHWIERGGPEIVAPPRGTGFGTRLAQTMIVRQLRGILTYDWQPSGLNVTIVLPVKSLAT